MNKFVATFGSWTLSVVCACVYDSCLHNMLVHEARKNTAQYPVLSVSFADKAEKIYETVYAVPTHQRTLSNMNQLNVNFGTLYSGHKNT